MITISKGLSIGLIVLELIKQDKEFCNKYRVNVGTFTNCSECGLTFMVMEKKSFTWCIYEHRNSDSIIINGKEGYISLNDELPYKAGNKYDYLASFSYNEYYEAAEKLKELITKFLDENKYD
jgi:hypothetical protein